METYFRVRKVLTCLLFIVAFMFSLNAIAGYIDFRDGGKVIAEPVVCAHQGKNYLCVPVEKDGNTYVVLWDAKGEALIYQVVKGEALLLWARDAA